MIGENLQRARSAVAVWIDSHAAGRLLYAVYYEVQKDDIFGMAAEMAYRFLFAIFPLLLFLVSALGFAGDALGIDNLFEQLLAQAAPFLPGQVNQIVDQYVSHLLTSRSTAFLTAGLLGTLWGAAGGVGTLIKGLNRAYDVETGRPFWKRQLLAITITLTLPPAGLVLLLLSVLGHNLANLLGDWLGLGTWLVLLMDRLRWPVLVVFFFLCLSMLYHVLPNYRRPYLWSLPGSLLGTAGWLLLTQGFTIYVANFGNYNTTYGSFGAAIAFLLWLYFSGVLVLVGAEINQVLHPARRKRRWRRELSSPAESIED